MTRPDRTVFLVTILVALALGVVHGQGPQGGRGGVPLGTGRAPVLPPLMQTPPKPAIPNAKPVRSCESLAAVALPNTTIESAAVDPMNPLLAVPAAINQDSPVGDGLVTVRSA